MIRIVPIAEYHQQQYYNLAKNNIERLVDFFPITLEKTETLEKSLESIRLYNMLAQQNDLHILMIEEETNKETVGFIILKNIDKRSNKCELVYFIDKDMEGKGYASSAVKNVINWAFRELSLNKIYCKVAVNHMPANRIAIKNGFLLEGTLKQELKANNGSLIDLNYYGLLKQD